MNIFASILGYALGLLPVIVTGIEKEIGDSQSGATKKQMATDALNSALQGAATVLVPGSTNAQLAQGAGAAAGTIIDASSTIADAVSHITQTDSITQAVNLTRQTGAYQAATKVAAAKRAPQTANKPQGLSAVNVQANTGGVEASGQVAAGANAQQKIQEEPSNRALPYSELPKS